MNKFLLIINGETYRHGPQGSRERGTTESFELQNFATQSHINFIEYVTDKFNLQSDVLLYYYKINEEWDSHFENSYKKYLSHAVGLPNLLGEIYLHSSLIQFIKNNVNISEYKFVLFIRPDLYLKRYFFEIFNIDEDKIKFAHVNEITDHLGNSWHETHGYPAVNHQIFYVPNRFFHNLLNDCIWKNHYSYPSSLNCGILKEQIGFFLETYHSSSTSNTWNPIFHQVGREETKFWVDQNFIVDNLTHRPKKVEYDKRYDNLLKNDFTENYYG